MPQLHEYGNMILEQDIIPVHHMCGLLNALLEMIDELPAMANEAYTTRPLGDVSIAEGRNRMPSKALIGGTNAPLLLKPVEEILDEVLPATYVTFNPQGFAPTAFLRGGRRYDVRRLNAHWVDRSLCPPRHSFSVTVATGDVYQLSYTQGEPFWRLESIVSEG